MMLSNLNLSSLPECNFEVRYVDSVLLNPCAEYQRLLRMGKVAKIAANFSEYIANEPKVSYRDGRYFAQPHCCACHIQYRKEARSPIPRSCGR